MWQNKVGFSVGIAFGMDVDARLTKLSVARTVETCYHYQLRTIKEKSFKRKGAPKS